MLASTTSPVPFSAPEWVASPEGQQICRRIGKFFPLSPDTSIRRVLRRAVEIHGAHAEADALVHDAVNRLRDAAQE